MNQQALSPANQGRIEDLQARIEDLQARFDAAQTEEESQRLRAELDALQTAAAIASAEIDIDVAKAMGVTNDPRVVGYYLASFATGLVLNVLLVVSGVGLVQLRPRGRTLALWTSALKIARLALIDGYYLVVVIPLLAQLQEEVAQTFNTLRPPGSPAPGMTGSMYAAWYTISGIAFIAFGVIYPAIVLWLLNRPAVKAALLSSDRLGSSSRAA